MRKLSFLAALAVGLTLIAQAYAAEPAKLRFATVGVGSAWYNYGAGIAELAKSKLPEGSSIDVLPIAGGVGNIKLLQNGEAELAISFQTSTAEGCGGFGSFDKKHDKVRGLMGGLDTYYFAAFVTDKSGVKSWNEIAEGKVDMLTTKVGGTGESGVRQVLEILGSSKDKARFKSFERAATAAAISDGSAAGWAHVVTKGHPVATQLTTTTDMKMLGLPDEAIKKMGSEHGWAPAEVPANTFKGQTEPIKTVKVASNILVRDDVPEDVVYTITKTILDNLDKVKKIHAGLSDFDPKDAVQPALVGNCPFHPGAVKAYKEAGLM